MGCSRDLESVGMAGTGGGASGTGPDEDPMTGCCCCDPKTEPWSGRVGIAGKASGDSGFGRSGDATSAGCEGIGCFRDRESVGISGAAGAWAWRFARNGGAAGDDCELGISRLELGTVGMSRFDGGVRIAICDRFPGS